MIGRLTGKIAHVEIATAPGPKAVRTSHGFERDGQFSQQSLDDAVRSSDGAWDYLGEWHSHPASSGASSKDAASMCEIAADPAYMRAEPLLIVLTRARKNWVMRGYQWRAGKLVEIEVQEDGQRPSPSRPRRSG